MSLSGQYLLSDMNIYGIAIRLTYYTTIFIFMLKTWNNKIISKKTEQIVWQQQKEDFSISSVMQPNPSPTEAF